MKLGSVKSGGKRLAKGGVALLAAGAVVLAAFELKGSDDGEVAGPPQVSVRVMDPGTFAAAHPFAPYYVVPDKRVSSPAKLSRAAMNRFVTRPEAALAKGGLAGSPQIIRLELLSAEPLTVERVSFDVLSDAKPVKGWFTAQPACVKSTVRIAKLYLDSERGAVRYIDAKGSSSKKLSIALRPNVATILELQATTKTHRAAWTAELAVSRDGGAPQTVAVDDDGEPFRVTSARASRGYAPRFGATGISGFARDRSWDSGRIKGC